VNPVVSLPHRVTRSGWPRNVQLVASSRHTTLEYDDLRQRDDGNESERFQGLSSPSNGPSAQLRDPPQTSAELPRSDASEATTLATAR
jgi:hypothetical protein